MIFKFIISNQNAIIQFSRKVIKTKNLLYYFFQIKINLKNGNLFVTLNIKMASIEYNFLFLK